MTAVSESEHVGRLLHHPEIPDAAKGETHLLASAVTSMDAALARLPRTMPWSMQPVVFFEARALHHDRD